MAVLVRPDNEQRPVLQGRQECLTASWHHLLLHPYLAPS